MKHRTVAGTIRYTSMKPGKEGQERGREAFRFTHHGDGSVILRASCEIEEPDPTVLRDVIYHLGPGMVPRARRSPFLPPPRPTWRTQTPTTGWTRKAWR